MAEPLLQQGSTGTAVRDLQEALIALGFAPGAVDGAFGPETRAAVVAFQQSRGIAADGIVGKVTWINIDEADQSEPVLKVGSRGLPVRRLQSRMAAFGYNIGSAGVDGRFGPSTRAAVETLQGDRNLVIDGIVGPATWAVVNSLEIEPPP